MKSDESDNNPAFLQVPMRRMGPGWFAMTVICMYPLGERIFPGRQA